MRKLTIEFEPLEWAEGNNDPQFEHIHSYKVLETLKMDFEKATFVDLIECTLKDGVSIDDLVNFGNMEILNVLRSEGNTHTCLVKGTQSLDAGQSYDELDLDLIWTTPSLISPDRMIVSCIGAQENLLKFIALVKEHGGRVINMSFQKAMYQSQDLLEILTEKQREILITANKHGYYDYPRKIKSEDLAKKVDISRATLVEHLRKAELRIMKEILSGQS